MSALYQPGHRVNFLCFPEVWSYVLSGLDRVQRPRGTKSKMNKHPEQNHRVGLPLRPGPGSTSRGARKACVAMSSSSVWAARQEASVNRA